MYYVNSFSMEWMKPDTFEVSPWLKVQPSRPLWRSDSEKKKLFAAELAKNPNPLEAANKIFWQPEDAMWVVNNWLHDPVVLAAKKEFEQPATNLLDKDALARKLLKFSEEKDRTGQFYIVEAKERLAALRLYAELQGFIGNKVDISTNNYINGMVVKFVKPDHQQNDNKVIEGSAKTIDENPLPLNIKLVSAK